MPSSLGNPRWSPLESHRRRSSQPLWWSALVRLSVQPQIHQAREKTDHCDSSSPLSVIGIDTRSSFLQVDSTDVLIVERCPVFGTTIVESISRFFSRKAAAYHTIPTGSADQHLTVGGVFLLAIGEGIQLLDKSSVWSERATPLIRQVDGLLSRQRNVFDKAIAP